MQSKFFPLAFLAVTVFCASGGYAQQSICPNVESIRRERLDADDYVELQQNAPEQLQIRITDVFIKRFNSQNTILPVVKRGLPPVLKEDVVDVKAVVTEVRRSKSGLKNGDPIKIYYITNKNYFVGNLENWEAINPLLMEVNKEYKVFVKRVQVQNGTDTDDGYRYVPVAYSKSFAEVKVETANK
jgi:hypothetical protein